jgi:hypothetical protein
MHRLTISERFLAVGLLPRPTSAADGKKSVLQSATKLDDDFFLQGEYAGSLVSADSGFSQSGVQVIALGDGRFQAVEYAGGLPGNGWDMQTRRTYTGGRAASGLAYLTGNGRCLIVRPGAVLLKDDAGKTRGRLTKIERISQTLRMPPPVWQGSRWQIMAISSRLSPRPMAASRSISCTRGYAEKRSIQ